MKLKLYGVVIIMTVSILLRSVVAAPAATTDGPEALIDRGVQLRREGKPVEALELFERANAGASSARALAQMGLSEMSLHRWADAEGHLEAALARHDSEWITNAQTHDALEKSLVEARLHIGRLRVEGTNGAEVTIGERAVGRLPLAAPLHLNGGPVHLHAEAPGHQAADKDVVIAAGEEVVARMELDVSLPPVATVVGAPIVPMIMAVPTDSGRGRRWAGAGLIGGGVAAIATGLVWVAVDSDVTCDPAPRGTCRHLYNTWLQGWLAIGAGAVLVGSGAGLLLWRGHHQQVAAITVGPTSLFAAGQF
jgi:hypothetical protein